MAAAGYVFLVLAVCVGLFQLALALGAPLGEYTLGGKYPGRLPAGMRVAAVVQIAILFVFAVMVAAKAGIAFEQYQDASRIGAWVVTVFFAFGSVMNLASPSIKEKRVMGPANVIAFASTLVVAWG